MPPIVRIVTGSEREEEPGLFIPFTQRVDDTQVLEAALPELRKELARRWPVKKVEIRYRFPNPHPGLILTMTATAEGLLVIFLAAAAAGGGHEFGRDVAKQMASVVNKWLKRLEPKKKKGGRSRKG
jgi:hypothetical protein